MSDYDKGVADAERDMALGWITRGEKSTEYLLNHLKAALGASDKYINGYVTTAVRATNREYP